jgi:IS4 transposase
VPLENRKNQSTLVRRVTYRDPVSGKLFEFITTVFDVPAGVIASLYKRRWDIEKVFDELKNKLNESKAWATSPTAKKMQAHFLCLAHNLLELLTRRLAAEQ